MTVRCLSPPLSSRAKTRDPLPRSMVDEAYGLRIGPGVRPLDPGSALRFARDDSALSVPIAVIPGEDPGSSCRGRWSMRLTACGSARAFGRWIPGRRFASPGMTVRCLSIAVIPGEDPGSTAAVDRAMRLTACGSARAFGRWIPVRRFASPGMTMRCLSSSPSSRAKTRDPLPQSMGDEAYGLRIGPGVRPMDPGSALRFARDDSVVVCPHRCHPGRRPGIHCRNRWSMRLTACGSARALGRWIPVRRFASPGMTMRCLSPSPSSRAKTWDPLPQSMVNKAYGLRIGPGVRPMDPGSALRFARDDSALSSPIAVIPGRIQSVTVSLGSLHRRGV